MRSHQGGRKSQSRSKLITSRQRRLKRNLQNKGLVSLSSWIKLMYLNRLDLKNQSTVKVGAIIDNYFKDCRGHKLNMADLLS